jgi:membrane-associated phospholipid phosphatase
MRHLRDFWAVAAAFALCPVAAALAPADPAAPLRRLDTLVGLERSLGLYFEPALWRWLAARPTLGDIAGFLYVWGHLPATAGALIWARLERPRRFALARDAFVATQLIVVAGYLVVPTAPPRTLHGGFDPGGFVHVLQSPYAAMPSGHVAFAIIVAALVGSQVRALRWVTWLYPALVTAVVIGTANHLWLDAVAGATAAGVGVGAVVMARTVSARGSNRCPATARTRDDAADPPANRQSATAATRA